MVSVNWWPNMHAYYKTIWKYIENKRKIFTCYVFESLGADGDNILAEKDTHQIRQIDRAALYIHTFTCIYIRILEMF